MEINRELEERLKELSRLKEEIKEKIKSLEKARENLHNLFEEFFSIEIPESQKFTFKRMKSIETQVNSLEKVNDSLKKYYELLKDITEKEFKILAELKKGELIESEGITQQQFWLLLSKLKEEE